MGVGTSLLTRCLLLKKREESRFGLRPETGNGLTDHCSEKPQSFIDFGQVVVFSEDSRRAGVDVHRAWIQAVQLSAVSEKMQRVNSSRSQSRGQDR